MSDEKCGVSLKYKDGICQNKEKYNDGKCGIHSNLNKNSRQGRKIRERLIQDFLNREKHRNTNTYDTRLTGLRAFDKWLQQTDRDLLAVGPLDIEDHVNWLISNQGRGVSDATAKKYVDQISKLFQYLEKKEKQECGSNDVFGDNPVREAELSLNTEYSELAKNLHDDDGYVAISPDEFDELVDKVQPPAMRNELILQLMWDTGLRPVEVCDIRLSDIDHENREIAVRSEKTHLNRTVFYGDKLATMLNIWLNGGERDRYLPADESPYLFISPHSEQMGTHIIRHAFKEAAEAADLYNEPVYIDAKGHEQHDLKPYSLRHGYAERMLSKPDIDIEMLRDTMGHRDVTTTQKYLNPDKETRRTRIQSALDE